MNEVLKDYTTRFVVVYLDDILIFNKTKEEHQKHLEVVLKRLHEEQLSINLEKWEFLKQELVYLGFVVSQGTLKMDPSKVEAILNWPTPTIGTKVRSLHGLAQFYRKFIRNFSGICAIVLDTIKGGLKTNLKWTYEVGQTFKNLKQQVATQPILLLPSFDKLFTLECDASGVAVGGVESRG